MFLWSANIIFVNGVFSVFLFCFILVGEWIVIMILCNTETYLNDSEMLVCIKIKKVVWLQIKQDFMYNVCVYPKTQLWTVCLVTLISQNYIGKRVSFFIRLFDYVCVSYLSTIGWILMKFKIEGRDILNCSHCMRK